MGQPIVAYIAMPMHTTFGANYLALRALWRGATTRGIHQICSPSINSVLPHNFSQHLCAALNARAEHGVTHFAMLHADIAPQVGWLDILMDELHATKADIMSAVVPIKHILGDGGYTSTAIAEPADRMHWQHFKLTMNDIFKLPETFGIEDTPWPGRVLLVNTGCMVMPIGVAEQFAKAGGFRFETWIHEHEGLFRPEAISEDWLMSRWAYDAGLKVRATRKVQLDHWGITPFSNTGPWGDPALNAIKEEAAVA